MNGGAILLVAMGVVAACLLLGIGLFAFSRLLSPGRHQSVPCWHRDAAQAWTKGYLRYDHDRLDHLGPGGHSSRVLHSWQRAHLDLGIARPATAEQWPPSASGIPGIQVSCTYGTQTFDLALGEEHYTALRSWLESVPPGWNVNVA